MKLAFIREYKKLGSLNARRLWRRWTDDPSRLDALLELERSNTDVERSAVVADILARWNVEPRLVKELDEYLDSPEAEREYPSILFVETVLTAISWTNSPRVKEGSETYRVLLKALSYPHPDVQVEACNAIVDRVEIEYAEKVMRRVITEDRDSEVKEAAEDGLKELEEARWLLKTVQRTK